MHDDAIPAHPTLIDVAARDLLPGDIICSQFRTNGQPSRYSPIDDTYREAGPMAPYNPMQFVRFTTGAQLWTPLDHVYTILRPRGRSSQ